MRDAYKWRVRRIWRLCGQPSATKTELSRYRQRMRSALSWLISATKHE